MHTRFGCSPSFTYIDATTLSALVSFVEAAIGVELLDLVLDQSGDLRQHVGSKLMQVAESTGNEARALSVDALEDLETLWAKINV